MKRRDFILTNVAAAVGLMLPFKGTTDPAKEVAPIKLTSLEISRGFMPGYDGDWQTFIPAPMSATATAIIQLDQKQLIKWVRERAERGDRMDGVLFDDKTHCMYKGVFYATYYELTSDGFILGLEADGPITQVVA